MNDGAQVVEGKEDMDAGRGLGPERNRGSMLRRLGGRDGPLFGRGEPGCRPADRGTGGWRPLCARQSVALLFLRPLTPARLLPSPLLPVPRVLPSLR